MKLSHVLAFCCTFFLSTVAASLAQANPLGIAFKYTTNVSLYGKPTGMLIAGRCNRYDSSFAIARSKGAEVLAYLNPASRPDQQVCALDKAFYMNNYGAVPLWPYPTYGQRSIYANSRMTDMRPGSAWILSVVAYVEKLMREGKVDGVFLDVVGARPWGTSNWTTWSQTEKDQWTDGNIDLVRRIDAKRRAINPNFLVVNNNIWARGDTRGYAAEKYVDGVMIEHPDGVTKYHSDYIKKPFSNLGHKRILIIARNATEARLWAAVPAATHISSQSTPQYINPTVPAVSFKALTDR